MKINRNNKFVATGLAALAVAGLSVGATACLGNGATVAQSDITTETAATTGKTSMSDTTQNVIDADDRRSSDDGAGDRREADTDTYTDTSSVTTDLDVLPADESPVTDSPTTPASETPAADTDVVDDSTADDSADDSAPEISTGSTPFGDVTATLGATVEQVLFVGSNGNVDANIFAKEGGFGGNDIVAVKLVYYVGGIKTSSSASLGINASTTRSLWNAENLNLTEGTSVSVRLIDENGRRTYHDVVVAFSTMG